MPIDNSVENKVIQNLSATINAEDTGDFNQLVRDGYIESIRKNVIGSSYIMYTLHLDEKIPSVIYKNFFFIIDNKTNVIAYTNADTLLVDEKHRLPFVLITSLKRKFFAERAGFNNGKVRGSKAVTFWENYDNGNECLIYRTNNISLKYQTKKSFLTIVMDNICTQKKEVVCIPFR